MKPLRPLQHVDRRFGPHSRRQATSVGEALGRLASPWCRFVWILAVLALAAPAAAQVQPTQGTSRLGVAVQQFRVDDLSGADLSQPTKEAWGRAMAGALEVPLYASGRFDIVTRLDLNEVLTEAKLCGEGFAGADADCEIDLNLVHVLILGTITILSEDRIDVTVRFIDRESGALLHPVVESGSGPEDFSDIASRLVERAVDRFPLTGKIIEMSEGMIWTDLGTERGLTGQPVRGHVFRFVPVADRVRPVNIGTFQTTDIGPQVTAIEVELDAGYELRPDDVVTVSEVEESVQSPSSRTRTGTVSIEAEPEGATVMVDGEPRGQVTDGSLDLQLSEGTYELRVGADGYEPVSKTVDVVASQVRVLTFSLARLTSRLVLSSEPAGARLFLDGESIGTTPIMIASQPTGTYQVRMEADGFETYVADVQVEAGAPATVDVRLTPVLGALALVVEDETYRVSIDGEDRGQAGEIDLAPGTYDVSVTAPGRETYAFSQRILAGERVEVAVPLAWAPNLSIVAPDGTSVTATAEGRIAADPLDPVTDSPATYGLAPGAYALALEAPDGARYERVVTVAPGEMTEVVFPDSLAIDAPEGEAAAEDPPETEAKEAPVDRPATPEAEAPVDRPTTPEAEAPVDRPATPDVEAPVAPPDAEPDQGILRVSSNIRGATLTLQGQEPMTFEIDGPMEDLLVPSGLYFSSATAPGARAIDDALSVVAGETTNVELTFELAPVGLRVGPMIDDGTARVAAHLGGEPSGSYTLQLTGPESWNGGAPAEAYIDASSGYLWVSDEPMVPGTYVFSLSGTSLNGYSDLAGSVELDPTAAPAGAEIQLEVEGSDLLATWTTSRGVDRYVATLTASGIARRAPQHFEHDPSGPEQLTFTHADLAPDTNYTLCVSAWSEVEDLGMIDRIEAARSCRGFRTNAEPGPERREAPVEPPVPGPNPPPPDPGCGNDPFCEG